VPYADAHRCELIERYQPAMPWNDITYPKAREVWQRFFPNTTIACLTVWSITGSARISPTSPHRRTP